MFTSQPFFIAKKENFFGDNQYFKFIDNKNYIFQIKNIAGCIIMKVSNKLYETTLKIFHLIMRCNTLWSKCGELYAFQQNKIQIEYYAFEPDNTIFNSLKTMLMQV